MWTHFWDMHSGGGQKEKWSHIYIEAPEEEAKFVFYHRFGHNPDRVTCTCCGNDYSISSDKSLKSLTGFQRNCRNLETPQDENGLYVEPHDSWWKEHYYLDPSEEKEAEKRGHKVDRRFSQFGNWVSLADYRKQKDVLFIDKEDIQPHEKEGDLPEQGYVWKD